MATATCGVYLSNGDGSRWELTLTYNATTGQPLALVATNSSARTAELILTITGTPKTYRVPPGETAPNASALASALSAIGLTNINTQLRGVSGVSV